MIRFYFTYVQLNKELSFQNTTGRSLPTISELLRPERETMAERACRDYYFMQEEEDEMEEESARAAANRLYSNGDEWVTKNYIPFH